MRKKKKPLYVMTGEEAAEWMKRMRMVTFKPPTFRERKQGECDDCPETIVCWGMDEPIPEEIPKICKYKKNK